MSCANLALIFRTAPKTVAVGARGCTGAGEPGSRTEGENVTDLVPLKAVLEDISAHRSTIGCVIPADNEEDSITQVIESLLGQTRLPDIIHVVVNDTSDATVRRASQFAGPHEVVTDLGEQFTEVFVHDIGGNPHTKIGALNYGFTLVEGYDYLLGVDAGTVVDARAVEYLEAEAVSDSSIGSISLTSAVAPRSRNPAVPAGEVSLFSVQALRDVMTENHQSMPWTQDDRVGDSLLSLQMLRAGYLTKTRPCVRTDVRVRGLQSLGTVRNRFVRVAFVGLVAGSLSLAAVIALIRRRHGYEV
jgi:hypothetical protein